MAKTINFGIDLGTTNSVIAKCSGGTVELFRNPLSLKETLPSVVAYRKNRILVGDKAREYLERDPDNVFGAFKRKMGTTATYYVKSLDQEVTPIDLSAQVLKELKTFIHTGEGIEAAVITIPAAFDTIQSNATKEAGIEAGFKHVVLLQEPIAASLAYANRHQEDSVLTEGQWLVYDLGGGTFDVALVRIKDGEMRVLDHEGDNFLGGADFDALIVEQLVVPVMEATGKFRDLLLQMRSAKGKYNGLYLQLVHKAEEAKIQLSAAASADIEFEAEDTDGDMHEFCVTVTRAEFESLVDPWIGRTVEMVQAILYRNNLQPEEVAFVLMVGGSTYIPRVRDRVGKELSIPVNCNIDPTSAVGIGAAFYAATRTYSKEINLEKEAVAQEASTVKLDVRMAYQKTSQEKTEYFTAMVSGDITGLLYRIVREDMGFDSGMKPLTARIEEDLPLIANTFNYFRFTIYNDKAEVVVGDLPDIGIAHGKFSVTGQPLPNDICIEVDDLEHNTTRLEVVFRKNEVLPLRRTFIKTLTRTLRKGAEEEILIRLLEGPEGSLPAANLPIGHIAIEGVKLQRDLVKGSDVEITVEISESRDLRITAYLMHTDQEFSDVFKATRRYVHLKRLIDELEQMLDKLRMEAARSEDGDGMGDKIIVLMGALEQLLEKAKALPDDDVTDARYQLEDLKRKLAQDLANLTKDQELTEIKLDFSRAKRNCQYWVDKYGSEPEKRNMEEILSTEKSVMRSNHPARIRDAAERLWNLMYQVRWRTMEFLSGFYMMSIHTRRNQFIDQEKAAPYLTMAEEALASENVYNLQLAISKLWELLPHYKGVELQHGTGIG